MSKDPRIKAHTHALLLCTGGKCAPKREIKAVDKRLKAHISRFNRAHPDQRIQRIKTRCLGPCKAGPLLVVYPDNVWYCRVDEAALERIFCEHLGDGQPVADQCFYRAE